ncbi:sulfite exporter TauE/SafE family protein [Vagococcus hydrophili]|uniref:Probable membrane transporter protein n=1 Tax=Vagococcus hydrophili TaxID=2714947 RepID=A0A6G8AUQ3_9ENTE|nr:sulfite exporter TauE/SafE family protein [Vagococcus hydrophili]QIL48682.1 sulfite exporter TauE/SafE family protein [Vagococcus hydrophili]
MIGILYFIIIVCANTIGAISGMGGGVLIKPIFDLINVHSVAAVSFYSSVAVLTMSIVSTYKQTKNGIKVDWPFALQISVGAVVGGLLGNGVFEKLLHLFPSGREVQLVQIVLTVFTLLFSFLYSKSIWRNFKFESGILKIGTGLLLGFLASLLGIGGGPINVALIMLLFNVPIKEATVYSIISIFFSQLSKVTTIFLTVDLSRYDLTILYYVIPAAIIGGFVGSYISKQVTDKKVNQVYQVVIILVLLINIYNGWSVF